MGLTSLFHLDDIKKYAIGELGGITKPLLERIFKYEALEESLKPKI